MRHVRRVVGLSSFALLVALIVAPLWAQQKTVHVKGYVTKTGKVVQPYDRAAPGTKTPATSSSTPSTTTPASSAASTPAAAPATPTGEAAAGSAPELFAIVTDGTATGLYHRKGCPWLTNHTFLWFSGDEIKKRYFQAHCLCVTGKEGLPPCEPTATAAGKRP